MNIFKIFSQVQIWHTFNPSTWRQRQVNLEKFKDSLVYIAVLGQPDYVERPCLKGTKYMCI